MDRNTLIRSANQLPRWVRVAFATRIARLVQSEFSSWMNEQVYFTTVEESLRFAEQCAVLGENARIPLNLPDQVSKLAFAAAEAARSTWDDDLDPDARPSGYAACAYAAASAAEAAAHAVLTVGWLSDRRGNLKQAIDASIQAKKHSATQRWFNSYDKVKAAQRQAEKAFLVLIDAELNKLSQRVARRGLTDDSGVPWHLFCPEDPTLKSSKSLDAEAMRPEYASAFISYSHRDAAFAKRLFDALKKEQVECWLDEYSLKPGDRILDSVAEAIGGSEKLLLCCSEASLQSWWVKDEIRKAQEKERNQKTNIIIPLMLDQYLLDGWYDGLASDIRSRLAADFIGADTDDQKFARGVKKILESLHLPRR